MRSIKDRFRYSEFYRIFNFREPLSIGRSTLLLNTLLANIGNIFITGVFYTGFLSINGIDIVRVGIITFIPYIAWGFSLLTPIVFRKVRRRRGLLLFNHIFYYVCVVLATTIMPMFVSDAGQRTVWFAVLLFIGNVSNAILASGAFAWQVHFIPDGEDRNIYFSYSNLIGSLVSTVVAISSSLFADSLAGSPQQAQIITLLRLVAAGVFVINGLQLYLVPREFPYHSEGQTAIREILTTPFRSRKFMLTAVIAILWNAIANVNGSTWPYYVLNTVGVGYTYMYISTIVYTLGNIFLLRAWRKAINRYSWFSVLFLVIFVTALMELCIGFSTKYTIWVYVVVSIIQGFNAVGTNLVFANLFYVNLPKGNNDAYITFWNLVCNLSVLVGSVLGTWFLSLVEPHAPWTLFGLPFYGSQFLVWIKFISFMLLCVYLKWAIPHIQPDQQ